MNYINERANYSKYKVELTQFKYELQQYKEKLQQYKGELQFAPTVCDFIIYPARTLANFTYYLLI